QKTHPHSVKPQKPHRLHGHNPPIDLDRDTAPDNQIPALKSRARAAKPARPEHYAPPATSPHQPYYNPKGLAPIPRASYRWPQPHAGKAPEPDPPRTFAHTATTTNAQWPDA